MLVGEPVPLGESVACYPTAPEAAVRQLTDRLAEALRRLIVYPLCWLAEGWLAWGTGGARRVAGFAGSLGPTGFFALTWWERLARMRRDARGFFQFLVGRDLHARLLERRRTLVREMIELARGVPDAVLAGQADDAR